MKLRITFQTVVTVALLALAGLAGASSGSASPPPPPGNEQYCYVQYVRCLHLGGNPLVCAFQRQKCLFGTPVVVLPTANTDSPLRSDAELEQQTRGLRSLIAANARPQASSSMSWVYCRKMADRCQAGDASACNLFDRYCGG
ncbi:MAG: hypothetical protein HYV17_07030 [Xanthomonadales bacterium]|nr:hypothetical protein [Xanthomonadales bacterium]